MVSAVARDGDRVRGGMTMRRRIPFLPDWLQIDLGSLSTSKTLLMVSYLASAELLLS